MRRTRGALVVRIPLGRRHLAEHDARKYSQSTEADAVTELSAAGIPDMLQHFHDSLEAHFVGLRDQRARITPAPPVFALEHDLPEGDLSLLQDVVRRSIAIGAPVSHRRLWLPFVVHATEIGYDYEGDEYWDSFAQRTPNWNHSNRHWFKTWFTKFANEFGGAYPQGQWASNFTIIAWPITHAVLPIYLQRQFARLLFDFRGGLSLGLLRDPSMLGERLASRANSYSDRFRVFAQNTALMGQVAAALLSGEEEESLYLTNSTLDRVVAGLTRERQAREWLRSARQRAGQVRTSGFQPAEVATRTQSGESLPRVTDPKLLLRRVEGSWRAFVELPDLTTLSDRLPHVYENLRTLRGTVTGGSRPIPRGGLVYSGQEIRLARWPDPQTALVQLEGADEAVNSLMADQCVMSPGPWWIFRRHGEGLALEVKGRFVRPGHDYILVGTEIDAPRVSWCRPVALGVDDATAFELSVPQPITEADRAHLANSELATVSTASIRPVGIVASSWNGEGLAEWIAGEPAMLEIGCTLVPDKCRLTIDGKPYFASWPADDSAIVVALQDLSVGPHEVRVDLSNEDGKSLAEGSVAILIREPATRPDSADIGEGLRMRVTPARPTLTELWDASQLDSGREPASITIQGPPGTTAELVVSLTDDRGKELAEFHRRITLPMYADAWMEQAEWIRDQKQFANHYDNSEGCILSVSRGGLGFATLTCDRGFQPLRWRFSFDHDRNSHATLSDRTDAGDTHAEFFTAHDPMRAIPHEGNEPIDLPPSGGLLRAIASDFEALAIAPTNPTLLVLTRDRPPKIPQLERNLESTEKLVRASWMWASAILPADPFATNMQHIVLRSIASANAGLIGGAASASVERKLASTEDPGEFLDDLQAAVGKSPSHVRVAKSIYRDLYKWDTPERFAYGFGHCVRPILERSGLPIALWAPGLLLDFAALPGTVLKLPDDQRRQFLTGILKSPVLLRAARFATVANQEIHDLDREEVTIA